MNTKTERNTKVRGAPDLRVRAPRSARVRLGGFSLLPRLLDKARADIAGTIGDYHTNCPIDREFLDFLRVDYDGLRAELEQGASDCEALAWILENAASPRQPWEVDAWNAYQEHRAPDPFTDLHAYFSSVLESHNRKRGDVRSWQDLLDLDDYCSFGGIA